MSQQSLLLVWVLLLLLFYSQYSLQLLVEQNTQLQNQVLECKATHFEELREVYAYRAGGETRQPATWASKQEPEREQKQKQKQKQERAQEGQAQKKEGAAPDQEL
jgi:hypothetical protein